MAKWPQSFTDFAAAYGAAKIILKLSNYEDEEIKLMKIMKARLLTAKSRAAMADPTMFVAQGSWSRSRQRFLNRRDGGNSGSLIG
jgi:hypothetical protein